MDKSKFIIAALIFLAVAFHFCDVSEVEEVEDYTYSITKVWWTDSVDNNSDGYLTSKTLNLNLDLKENVTRTVLAQIYYKLEDAATYSFYGFSEEYIFEGVNSPLSMEMIIGVPNKELNRGIYEFQIEIYEKDSDRREAIISAKDSNGTVLTGQTFEELASDQIYTLTTWWNQIYDHNENGYARFATLGLNVDIDGDYEKELTANILIKGPGEDEYEPYLSSDKFTIKGTDISDSLNFLIGARGEELSSGMYDFKIELKEIGSFYPVASADADNDVNLNDVKFELYDEDSYLYSIVSETLNWIDPADNDNDGYTTFRKFVLDVNVDKDATRDMFAKIYVRHPDSTEYQIYDSTAVFQIYGSANIDTIQIPVGTAGVALDSAKYSFIIAVYEDVPDSMKVVEANIGGDKEGDILYMQQFETAAQDSAR